MDGNLVGVIVYILGLSLLFLELFIPSGGILGITGTLCALYGIWEIFTLNVFLGAAVLILTILYIVVLIKFWAKRVTLTQDLSGAVGDSPEASPPDLVGHEGVTLTMLRPAGFASIGNQRLQVVTDGKYLKKDVKIRVVEVSGNRIVVTRLKQSDNGSENKDAT